jgi:hypothetical protein
MLFNNVGGPLDPITSKNPNPENMHFRIFTFHHILTNRGLDPEHTTAFVSSL